ncbi:MAG: protein kinase [Candidatus Schekmanbacteria bacterium]|nr:protein kinase [Candidatus Schekmanbacteria bacterium]
MWSASSRALSSLFRGGRRSHIASFLAGLEAFSSLSEQAIEHLVRAVHVTGYPRGTAIVRKGEPGTSMFIVVDGMVEVPVLDGGGRPVFRAILRRGECFGEIAVLTGLPRTADVVAFTECTVLCIPREPLFEAIREYPKAGAFLTSILGDRLASGPGLQRVGKYELVKQIGRGSMGVVYEARHPLLRKDVALKMLPHSLVHVSDFRERFLDEARRLAALRHPNIVQLHDCEEAYATIFIVMEMVTGPSLESILCGGPLSPDRARRMIRQLAGALDHAHSHGIVHRDVKPSNVLTDERDNVRLTDFGIAAEAGSLARALDTGQGSSPAAGELAQTHSRGHNFGTPRYVAPEVIAGEKVDARADIYAMGVLLFEALVGRHPFAVTDVHEMLDCHLNQPMPEPRQYNPLVPEDLNALVIGATAKRPTERLQTCQEVLRVLDGQSGAADITTAVEVETITFVYSPAHRSRVEAIVEETRRKARAIPGLLVS